MKIINKDAYTISFMSREETGIVSPMSMYRIEAIMEKGYTREEANTILDLMNEWKMSFDEAITQREKNKKMMASF